jgi:hypothetical protein
MNQMRSFVRGSQNDHWDRVLIGIAIGTMMFAVETLGEIAYLPLYAFLAIESAKALRRGRAGR